MWLYYLAAGFWMNDCGLWSAKCGSHPKEGNPQSYSPLPAQTLTGGKGPKWLRQVLMQGLQL